MPEHACVVLHHDLPGQPHHDWLMVDPRDPAGLLWAARVMPPPVDWLERGEVALRPLPPHRRVYLSYEGALTGNRGAVRRVAEGAHQPSEWTSERIVTVLHLAGLPAIRVEVVADRARFVADDPGGAVPLR